LVTALNLIILTEFNKKKIIHLLRLEKCSYRGKNALGNQFKCKYHPLIEKFIYVTAVITIQPQIPSHPFTYLSLACSALYLVQPKLDSLVVWNV